MNIFFLDEDINKSCEYHVDKHVVKQILEYCQMLSTALRVNGMEDDDRLYKIAHLNHPCTVWVRESRNNFQYLFDMAKRLSDEYTYRYGKIHASSRLFSIFEENKCLIPEVGLTQFPICMDDQYKVGNDVIESYRNYYNKGKRHLFNWKNRNIPEWIEL